MSDLNFSFELHTLSEAITPYGTLETKSPAASTIVTNDFREGEHFRTGPEDVTNHLQLELEDRILTLIVDESGSMTWNDNNADRYTYLKRLLTKLDETYPAAITTNVIGFGGVLTNTNLFTARAGIGFLTEDGLDAQEFIQSTFEDSVYDFAGVRVVRRTDRFPLHPADGIVVSEGIIQAAQDTPLTDGQLYYYGVWSFNGERHYSPGYFITGTPQDRILPQGVNFATAVPRILPGVARDNNTELIYNFKEELGYLVFDSSGQGNHGTIGSEVVEHSFWAGDSASGSHDDQGGLRKPAGVRFDGEFDIIEVDATDNMAWVEGSGSGAHAFSLNFWIYRYANTTDQWVIGTADENSNTIGWVVGIDSTGVLAVNHSTDITTGLSGSLASAPIPEKEWTMVSMALSQANYILTVYINGVNVTGVGFGPGIDTRGFEKLYIGAKPTNSATTWAGSDFFGSLAQISIHTMERDAAYWEALYVTESEIFNQPLYDSALTPPDNKQREVLLSWIIGNDFDYEGGYVKIVRKYLSIPWHDEDGEVVTTVAASEGEFYYIDANDFIHNEEYYYRVFTVNSSGAICDRSEARALSIHIPKSTNDAPNPALGAVQNETILEGDRKLFLQWRNPTDSRWVGTKVYFGIDRFPTVGVSPNGELQISDGGLIADTTGESLVHRESGKNCDGAQITLTNGISHFYTIVTYDNLGRISAPQHLVGIPTATSELVFPPADISDLHLQVINPITLSLQWKNPTVKNSRLDLWLSEAALVFVNLLNKQGGKLQDIDDMNLLVCTTIEKRSLVNDGQELGVGGGLGDYSDNFNPRTPCEDALDGGDPRINFSVPLDENCNNDEEEAETSLTYATIESGLIKGIVTPTGDRDILARRERYIMNIGAQYKVSNPDNPEGENLFEFNTEIVTVTFQHPIEITAVNKSNRHISVGCGEDDNIDSLDSICYCNESGEQDDCKPVSFNGGYARSTIPYVCRIELQFKGESLPDGTPVTVQLFSHDSTNPLTIRSERTFMDEGVYSTSAVTQEELDYNGVPTGRLISKSIVDIEVPAPQLPDFVDLYVSLDFVGFFVDAIHEIRFIDSLFIRLDAAKPYADGIEVAEQFATVWQVDPDDPDPNNRVPVTDGTLVKWELVKKENGKDRPFYSTEELPLITGIYSATISGVARNVFFGPVGNLEINWINLVCTGGDGALTRAERCCLAEEYEIHASTIVEEQTAKDSARFGYSCEEKEFANRHFFINGANPQPIGAQMSNPHYFTWADGEHLVKFQIARNAALATEMPGWQCFINCTEEEQLLEIPEGYIAQISAPGEILWDVTFDEDPYTGELTPLTYESVEPDETGSTPVANIPLDGLITDFYLRLNRFMGDGSAPKQMDCESGTGGGEGSGGGGEGVSPCEWVGYCDSSGCYPTEGVRWDNVEVVSGRVTLVAGNQQITLFGGGEYETGVPPIYAGFQEPLDVRIVDARANGERIVEFQYETRITFVVEATFAEEPVPDGTIIELSIPDDDSGVVTLSDCAGIPDYCDPALGGVIYTQQINDPDINPTGDVRSLAYFTIEPIANIEFTATINVTCRYDKLGTVDRQITRCITLSNSIAQDITDPPDPNPDPEDVPEQESAANSEAIVYDTVDDVYERVTAGLINRMGHFMASNNPGTADLIYVMGGWSVKGDNATTTITPTCEVYNANSMEWEFTTDMPAPRCYGMTVSSGDYIYCIGGVEVTVNSQLEVSRKTEAFDIVTETWNPTLAPMPEGYGVAFGDAQVKNGYIYVTCGILDLVNDSKAGELNDKILRYSIADDEWIEIEPSNSDMYKRITPFAFLRDKTSSYYVYGGSIPKPAEVIEAERLAKINELLNEFRSFILTSAYYQNLSIDEQMAFVAEKETEIRDGVIIPAFYYPLTGFKFILETEYLDGSTWRMDISDTLDDEWAVLPLGRDHGQCVYIPHQDIAYFMGGSNQNQSTTLNRNESIDLSSNNFYERRTPFNSGRSHFRAIALGDDIYLSGGLKSGHASGWVQINVLQMPEQVETLGVQSGGLLLTLTNDAGEIIEDPVRVDVRGRVRVPEVDDALIGFLAERAAIRALGGEFGEGVPDLPDAEDELDIARLIEAQNQIIDPNSDTFQRNAASKLNERIFLFPVLYSTNETVVENGVGGVTLLPRSEDPLADLQRLAEFIQQILQNTPDDTDERFAGDLTREELAALGDVLETVEIPPTVVNSGVLRPLYDIETFLTVLDDIYFGQTVSEFDLAVQDEINSRIRGYLTPPPEEPDEGDGEDEPGGGVDPGGLGGSSGGASASCFVLEHAAAPVLPPDPPPPDDDDDGGNPPTGGGDYRGSGQCLFCDTLLPTQPDIRDQLPTVATNYYNIEAWVPQIKRHLTGSTNTISNALTLLDTIDYEIPFGSSQLYDALTEGAQTMAGDTFADKKKVIYICSDNSENLSLTSRFTATEEVNSIDGDRNTPIVYTVFSTSYPVSVAAMLERTESSDVDALTKDTGGQSSTLVSTSFLDWILNLTLGGATGGLGYGIYTNILDLSELSSITAMSLDFFLPDNTQGRVRLRSSDDGFNYTDWTERFTGSGNHDFVDFFAQYIEFEVVLSTGFTTGITEEYDATATGIPKLRSITWETSQERQDLLFVDTEDVLTNAQQVAMAFEGDIPTASVVELGVATSDSHQWADFYSSARPIVEEFGKTFLLERDEDADSAVPTEPLTTDDNIRYQTTYGSWDPEARVDIVQVDPSGAHANVEIPVFTGFRLYPREGEIYFDTRQPPDRVFKITVTNEDKMRVGLRLRNRRHSDSITMEGVGFIYSTNDEKPALISQVAPSVLNVTISPQNPNSSDTIFALYDFIDLNNDDESGSLISWYKNGQQLFEIQNNLSWSDSDLLSGNKLVPNDKIHYIVIPSDGRSFGSPVYSPAVIVVARPPGADDVRIVPFRNGVINNRYDTSSSFVVQYDFEVEDTGPSALEVGTVIKWYVNGRLFKEGVFSELESDPYFDPKSIAPGEQIAGVSAHTIGNQIQVEVTPKTVLITGATVTSSTITVVNSIPIANNVQIEPLIPNAQSTLTLSYTLDDLDVDNGIQIDQSEIKWFNSPNGQDFAEVQDLRGEMVTPPFYTRAGEYWYVQVTPYDGLDLGAPVVSNIVTISA
jgi:hypothetical protein